MPRYVAFLRGVSPLNANMSELKKSFEAEGFTDVKTVLASGNIVFNARKASNTALALKAQKAMTKHLGRAFDSFIRSADDLRELLESDPYAGFRVPRDAKRVITFLREPVKTKLALPLEFDGATIFAVKGTEVFTAYVKNPRGPVFMTLIERTFGKDQTTRTLDTVKKCVAT